MSPASIAITTGLSLLVGVLIGYLLGRAEADDGRK